MGKPHLLLRMGPRPGLQEEVLPTKVELKTKLESNNYCPSPTSQLVTHCGMLCRQAQLTATPQQNDSFYSHHPGHCHSQPSARSGPQKDGPYWQQDAGASGHAVNAEQTLISEQGITRARFAQCSSPLQFGKRCLDSLRIQVCLK